MALTREGIIEFLNKKTRADLRDIADDAELFSNGLVDSFAMIDLMMFLEKKTGARLSPDDVTLDNFDTVARILAFGDKVKR